MNFKNMKKLVRTKLTKEEKKEFEYIYVSFRVCCDLLLRSRFLKVLFITYISIFLIMSLINIIGFVLYPSEKLLFDIPNYSWLIFALFVALIITLFGYSKIFSLKIWEGAKRYFTFFSIEWFNLLVLLFVSLDIILIMIGLSVPNYLSPEDFLHIWWYLIIYVSGLFTVIFLFPIFVSRYPIAHLQYFAYASNNIKKMKTIDEKIKAYTSIKLNYLNYNKELYKKFGKNAISLFKLNSIYLLALAILKLNVNNPKSGKITKILSGLQKIDPIIHTKKFVNIMEKIEEEYAKEFPHIQKDMPLKKERFTDYLSAKISIVFVMIPIILSVLRLLGAI